MFGKQIGLPTKEMIKQSREWVFRYNKKENKTDILIHFQTLLKRSPLSTTGKRRPKRASFLWFQTARWLFVSIFVSISKRTS